MPDSPDKIQWHPAFYAAAELELRDDIDKLELTREHNLSKEPIRIDLLIIKDRDKNTQLKNEIGHIMKTYNIIEYKSPEDGLSIDDFYKTVGYAFLYKGYGETVNQIPVEELTVSIFRAKYPREMFEELKKEGYSLEEKYPGIYYLGGGFSIPVQIVVTSRLSKENHSSLRILSDNAEIEDIEQFLNDAREKKSPGDRNNIDAVLQASMSANQKAYEDVRRDSVMCKAMEELMADVIEARVNEKVTERIDNKTIEYLKNIMINFKCTKEQALDALNIPKENRGAYMNRL